MKNDERALWARWVESGRTDLAARDELVRRYLPLAYSIMYRILPKLGPQTTADMAVSGAMFALFRSVLRFAPSRGFLFSTYAGKAIRSGVVTSGSQTPWGRWRARERVAAKVARSKGQETPPKRPFPKHVPIIRTRGSDWTRHDEGFPDLRAVDPVSAAEPPGVLLDKALRGMDQRLLRVLREHAEGRTYAEIGRSLGVSRARAQQLAMRGLRLARRQLGLPEDP